MMEGGISSVDKNYFVKGFNNIWEEGNNYVDLKFVTQLSYSHTI